MSQETTDTTTVTVRLTREMRNRLQDLARSTRRSKSFLAAEAIRIYLDLNEWQIRAIQEGLRDADEGRLVNHDQVAAWLESWGTEQEKEPPVCG